MNNMLNACRDLAEAGASLHWLKPARKDPIQNDWSTLPRKSVEQLERSYPEGANIGIRLGEPSKTEAGYLHLIDLDIRDISRSEEAHARLAEIAPGYQKLPCVISGSGGASRHYYFFSPTPLRGSKLAISAGFSMVWDESKGREVKKNDWEIELFGTGKQAVIPPSIHPDTRQPYRWERQLPLDEVSTGVGPNLSIQADLRSSVTKPQSDDLLDLVLGTPLDIEDDEIADHLSHLPSDWVEDRDEWLKVGAALHHQYRGGIEGLRKWCKWAKQSEKFDLADSKRVWKSFKERSGRPVTFRSIIDASRENRFVQNHEFLLPATIEDDDMLSDLLGDTPTTTVKSEVYDPDWMIRLDKTDEGVVKPTMPNVASILRNDPRMRGVLGFNRFTSQLVIRTTPKHLDARKHHVDATNFDAERWQVLDPINGREMNDIHISDMRYMLESKRTLGGWGLKVADRDLLTAISRVAHDNSFHSVIDTLERLPAWDKQARVPYLWIKHLGAADNRFHQETATVFMIAAVARIYEPGCKFDYAPILEGVQGTRKSSFIQSLAMGFYGELGSELVDKKIFVEETDGKWILEIPELQGFSKYDIRDLKAALSRQSEKVRRPYARMSEEVRRQSVMIGSTNDDEYLRDPTGGRRFWPIACSRSKASPIDINAFEKERPQLWAEALAMYREARRVQPKGDLPLYLRDEASVLESEELQSSRTVETNDQSLAGELEVLLNEPIGFEFDDLDENQVQTFREMVCGKEIWIEILGRHEPYDRKAQLEINEAMRYVTSWKKDKVARRLPRYGKQRVYRRS